MTTLTKRMGEMAEKCTEWHGCATGDCPHDTYRECFNAVHIEGQKAALDLPELKALEKTLHSSIYRLAKARDAMNLGNNISVNWEETDDFKFIERDLSVFKQALKSWREFKGVKDV